MSNDFSYGTTLKHISNCVVDLACFKWDFVRTNHVHIGLFDCADFFDSVMMTAQETGGTWEVNYSIPVWTIDWPERNIKPVPSAKELAVIEFKSFKRLVRDEQRNMDIVQLPACGTESDKIVKSFAHLVFNQGRQLWSPEAGDSWGIVG